MVSLVNSHTDATLKRCHLWEIDLGCSLNSTPVCCRVDRHSFDNRGRNGEFPNDRDRQLRWNSSSSPLSVSGRRGPGWPCPANLGAHLVRDLQDDIVPDRRPHMAVLTVPRLSVLCSH